MRPYGLVERKNAAPTSRHWSINGRFLSRNVTGVDRYALEILKAMDQLIGEKYPPTFGLALDVLCPSEYKSASPFTNIPLRSLPSAPGHAWEQFILPRHVVGGLVSMCNSGPLLVKKQIVCIHDVNTRLVPESYSFGFRLAYRLLEPALGRRVEKIVTVSNFSRSTMQHFGIAPSKDITVIPDGHEHVQGWDPQRSSLREGNLPQRFVLMVGSKAPHKNASIIYAIAADLAEMGIGLVVTGGENARVFASDYSEASNNLRHLGRVNDHDLAYLYKHALCLAFPSKTEGFGLPAIEAMALGCPVVCSDAASLPEVCGNAVLYANPEVANSWLTAIARLAEDSALRQQLVFAGLQQSKLFSWRTGAEKYFELMNSVDFGRPKSGLQ